MQPSIKSCYDRSVVWRSRFKSELRQLDVLSAVWILASNDRVPLITYEGVDRRLGLSANHDVRALVAKHGELFRSVTNPAALETWKGEMLSGRNLPIWISDMDPGSRDPAIKSLSLADVFRSQFRTEPNAPPSSIAVIKWGVDHIDGQRKALIDGRREKWRTVTALTPLISVIVAAAAILVQPMMLNRNLSSQLEMKKLELSSQPKHDGYAHFMSAAIQAFDAAYRHDINKTRERLDALEVAYYSVEPFLNDRRDFLWNQFQQFSAMCYDLVQKTDLTPEMQSKYFQSFLWYKKYFRDQLYEALSK